MWVTFGHLRPSGHIMPDHAGDRGTALLVLAPHDHLHIKQKRSARRAARPRSRSCYGLTTICRRGSRRQADLNTGLYRTVLRRSVSRRLSPEPSRAGHRARSSIAPGATWPGSSNFRLPFGLLKVSGANETGEPNGESTTTGTRPHQATSSHSHRWWMPHQATSSHVQRL